MNAASTYRWRTRARWYGTVILALFAAVLVIGTARRPHFWITADQRGDMLFRKGRFADAAKTYADPWRIGAAQYRNGDFEAAAKTFARVPGAAGAFDEGNARLMHGQYDRAVSCYDRALGFRPGWKPAEENKALAQARKAKLDASGKDREQEQTDAYTPDRIVSDRKGGEKKEQPVDLNGERMSDEAAREAWLRRVQTSPGDFLRAKFAFQTAQGDQPETGKRGAGK